MEGRVQLASGSWNWFSTLVRRFGQPGERWIVFWHDVNHHWRIRVKVERSWSGFPPVEALARGAMRLTVHGEAFDSEVFLLDDHLFVHRGKGDVGQLMPHDGRSFAELTEGEIEEILRR